MGKGIKSRGEGHRLDRPQMLPWAGYLQRGQRDWRSGRSRWKERE